VYAPRILSYLLRENISTITPDYFGIVAKYWLNLLGKSTKTVEKEKALQILNDK